MNGLISLTLPPPWAVRNTKPLLCLQPPATERSRELRLFTWSPRSERRTSCTCLRCLSQPPVLSSLSPTSSPTYKHTHTHRRGRAAAPGGVRTPIARTAAPLLMYGGLKAVNHSRKLSYNSAIPPWSLKITDGQHLDKLLFLSFFFFLLI